MRRFLSLILLGALATPTACGGRGSKTPGGDPVRMSESEYDVARDLWLRQRKPREALAHALEAVELDDENHEASHLAALIYLEFCSQGSDDCRLGEAERLVRQALDAKADFREAKNTLGVVLIHEKRYPEAIQVLKPLTEDILYQTPENAWGNLGWAYFQHGKLDLAIDALRRSLAAQPLFCVGAFRLGLALEKKGELTEAASALSQALDTQAPGCSGLQEALLARGRVHQRLGQAAEAEADFKSCLELSAKSPTGKECRSMMAKLK
ncbi:MAG: tetratricopeptide repeat protein [Polyangiaceae bacterium]